MAALKEVVILPCAEGFEVTDVVDGFNQISFALTVFFRRSSLFLEKIPFEGGYNFESALNPGIGLPFSA